MSKSWYTIRAAQDGANPQVSIDDEIGFWGITARTFLAELKRAAGDSPEVDVLINSPGGDVMAAVAMFNGARALGKKINVKVMGVAASAASYFAMAGDRVEMPENTFMFVHNPIQGRYGNAAELREAADELDKVGAVLMAAYAKRYTGTLEEMEALFAAETLMTAQECLAAGFCDEVTPAVEAKASWDDDKLPENVRTVYMNARKPAPAPTPAPAPAPAGPQMLGATEIKALADAAGVGAHAVAFATLAEPTKPAIEAAIRDAVEIVALVGLSSMEPAMAGTFIRAHKPLADVRAEVAAFMASGDDATASRNTPPPEKTLPSFSPYALWSDIQNDINPQRSK